MLTPTSEAELNDINSLRKTSHADRLSDPGPKHSGVRHGTDLKVGIAIEMGEARLFCNLIRSYIHFLITEHERLSRY